MLCKIYKHICGHQMTFKHFRHLHVTSTNIQMRTYVCHLHPHRVTSADTDTSPLSETHAPADRVSAQALPPKRKCVRLQDKTPATNLSGPLALRAREVPGGKNVKLRLSINDSTCSEGRLLHSTKQEHRERLAERGVNVKLDITILDLFNI